MNDNKGNEDTEKTNLALLSRFLEYCKYLYEEEKERTDYIEKKVNILNFLQGGSILSLILDIPISKFKLIFNFSQFVAFLLIILLCIAIAFILISIIFALNVYRVRRFERLSNPKLSAIKVSNMKNEGELILDIIADYVTAANKNHEINNIKAKNLSRSFAFILFGFILLAVFILSVVLVHPVKGA